MTEECYSLQSKRSVVNFHFVQFTKITAPHNFQIMAHTDLSNGQLKSRLSTEPFQSPQLKIQPLPLSFSGKEGGGGRKRH